jgi:hypothetical protein
MSARDDRRAWNQAVFRAANEAIAGPARPTGLLTFICECGDEACKDAIELTSEEYEAVRADPACFAVIPGHESRQERVLEEFERFALVEKLGADRAVVERMNPRARWKE